LEWYWKESAKIQQVCEVYNMLWVLNIGSRVKKAERAYAEGVVSAHMCLQEYSLGGLGNGGSEKNY
jgi:hypothetical protein